MNKETTEDMIARYEQMSSQWLAEKRDANAGLHDLAIEHQDTEGAARFRQRVTSADMVLASRYGYRDE